MGGNGWFLEDVSLLCIEEDGVLASYGADNIMVIWKEKKMFKSYASLAKGVGLFKAIPRIREFYVMTTNQEKIKLPKNALFHPIQR